MLVLCLDTPKDAADMYFFLHYFDFLFYFSNMTINKSKNLKNTGPRSGGNSKIILLAVC